MGWILHDFECPDCGVGWEEVVDSKDRETVCRDCGIVCTPILSAPNIAAFSIKSKEEQQASLKKRSEEHTRKELQKHGRPPKKERKNPYVKKR